jgi:hypothetical protein
MLPIGQRIQARATAANGEALIASFSDGGEANLVEQGGDSPPRLVWVTARTEPQSVILRRAVYVSGTVRWPNGDPASGALVSGSTYGGGGGMETAVDVQGRYQLGPLEPGRVNVFARMPEHPHRADTPSALAVRLLAAGSRDEDVHVVLRPPR